MSDPRPDIILLHGSIYQFLASQLDRQAAMLALSRVITGWSHHTDHIVIACDFLAKCQICQVGDDSQR